MYHSGVDAGGVSVESNSQAISSIFKSSKGQVAGKKREPELDAYLALLRWLDEGDIVRGFLQQRMTKIGSFVSGNYLSDDDDDER